MRNKVFLSALVLSSSLCGVSGGLRAADLGPVDVSGFVGLETRAFLDGPNHAGQKSGLEASVVFNPEFRYRTPDRNHQLSFIPFYRKDSRDSERSHFDVREAYWLWRGDELEVLTGINKVFWGVTESRHLVNIINQIDGVEDLDGEDYLGQPMVNVAIQRDWGKLGVYVLPGFRERTFPGVNGRFRFPIPVDNDNAEYESGAEDKHVDFAARYAHYFGDWDMGLSYFYGTDREPVFSPYGDGSRLIANYNLINQFGVDVQYTTDAWLWKFEGIAREGQGDTFAAAVGGLEYTFYQVFEKDWDIGVLAEYQYDGRDSDAPIAIQDRDVFGGVRWALNDVQDTEVLAGFSVDTKTAETFYNFEADTRIGSNYEIELRARVFSGTDAGEDTRAFEADDYVQVRFSRFF
jgi:hypothetical protein